MIVSLRIMNFGFLISVMVAVLIIGISRDATAQGNEVECPCDFQSVPMTTGCWTEHTTTGPVYADLTGGADVPLIRQCSVDNVRIGEMFVVAAIRFSVIDRQGGDDSSACNIISLALNNCSQTTSVLEQPITPEEVLACQCELLAYTTALNEGGISVSGGPPYVCGNVDLRTCQGLPPLPEAIPTLNEWGMITTAGVLGLLAVIGLFVMRRRKVSA